MTRTTLGLIVLVGVSVFFLLLGIGFLLRALFVWRQWINLQRNGVLIEGQITTHSKTRQGQPNSSLTYTYQYEGKTYSRAQDVSKEHYQIWEDGSAVTLHCLVNQPEVAALVGDSTQVRFALSIYLFSAALLLGSAIAFFVLIPLALHTPSR